MTRMDRIRQRRVRFGIPVSVRLIMNSPVTRSLTAALLVTCAFGLWSRPALAQIEQVTISVDGMT
jgi:hypothetical protein